MNIAIPSFGLPERGLKRTDFIFPLLILSSGFRLF